MSEHIHVEQIGHIVKVVLVRPEKKNALTGAMYETLIQTLRKADEDASVRAIVITGSGGVFSAGNDILDFISAVQKGVGEIPALRFVKAIAQCDTPLIAAVEGNAVGVGTTLCLHCDLVYAAPGAMFRTPFVDLGLVPEAGSSLLLPQRIGAAKAAEMLLLGDPLSAEQAHAAGLVNAVLPASELVAHAMAQANRLAAKPVQAIAATRRLMRGSRGEVLARIDEEAKAFAAALRSKEAQAAFAAFMTKSK
ncbi:enoyl-CoA hydratase-related protein [Methylovirgula sp. 4M-Z18]|uniref:enoyl-CoA hydratase-related protein n=1 Tax=Methylovirgula sp. 4M-Z18 TaxID=2293567 RepID=UPI000E2F18B0|nr:enoyl-CoA hydratase-related protein [Methylovirgula sp. 4M-Z18]RFB80132.1 enoyl-CoA hydratase [Methylovirgula sp. 4M-Z18]